LGADRYLSVIARSLLVLLIVLFASLSHADVSREDIIAGKAEITTSGVGALVNVGTLKVYWLTRLMCEVSVSTAALIDFDILVRAMPSASYQTIYSVACDYTSPAGILLAASGDLTTIGPGATGWFMLDVRAIDSVQLKAASGSSAGVTVRCGGL